MDSFCETSPTRASSLRMSAVIPESSCVSRASFCRVADSLAWTWPYEWPLSPLAGAASSRQPKAKIAKRRAMSEGSARRRTSLPGAELVPLLLGRQRPGLGDHGRLRRIAFIRRRIGLGDHGRPDRILLAGRGGLFRKLHHLRRLNLQPATLEPVLCLLDH